MNCEPDNLYRMVSSEESKRDNAVARIAQREQVAMGSQGVLADMYDDYEGPPETAENLGFAMYSLLLPSMLTDIPIAKVRSNGNYASRIQAAALQGATAQIMRGSRAEDELARCAWDFFFKPHCAAFVETAPARMSDLTKEEREDLGDRSFAEDRGAVEDKTDDVDAPRATKHTAPMCPARWPRIKWLPVEESGFDTGMGSFAARRFSWHTVKVSREELLNTARENTDWYEPVIAGLPTCREGGDDEYLTYHVVYVPGKRLPGEAPSRNQPGVIYTICNGGSYDGGEAAGVYLRKPYYWTGHPDGPHIFRGQYMTGRSGQFLSILAANENALAMTEAASGNLLQRIRDYKVVNVFDSAEQESATKIAHQRHNGWVGVPGWREGRQFVQQVETSAPTPAEVNNLALMQQTAARNLGMDDALQGRASAGATATAASIAANSTKTRLDYIYSRWRRFLRDCLERVIWEIAHSSEVVLRLDEQARAEVLRAQLVPLVEQGLLSVSGLEAVIEDAKRAPMLMQGGDFASEDGDLDWYSLDITVDPTSMTGEYGEQSVARHNMWNETLYFMGNAMREQPYIRWIDRARATGRALGIPDCDMAIDLEQLEALQIQIAEAASTPKTAAPEPGKQGATLRMAQGGANAASGVDGGAFQVAPGS